MLRLSQNFRPTVVKFLPIWAPVFALAAVTLWLVYVNRSSEKVVSVISVAVIAVVTPLFMSRLKIGSEKVLGATLAAVLTVWLSVLVFGGGEPITEEFPACFFYRSQNKMPADLSVLMWPGGRFTSPLFYPAQLYRVHPERFNDASDPYGRILYHHLLQKAILEWLHWVYGSSWQPEVTRWDMPLSGNESYSALPGTVGQSEFFSANKIESTMGGNWFAAIHSGYPEEIAFPKATTVTVTPPSHNAEYGESAKIVVRNSFCTLSIDTRSSFTVSGISEYSLLAGLSPAQDVQYMTSTYVVEAKAQFSRLRGGDPDMPRYVAWAKQLIDELKGRFDERLIWRRTWEDYVVRNQVHQFGPVSDR
jgi:hypothetical protein